MKDLINWVRERTKLTVGPKPHLRGYKSRSMTTLLILATTPWSQLAIVEVVIRAIAVKINKRNEND